MSEAQIIEYKGQKAIAIYLRDKTNLVKARKLMKKIEKLKNRDFDNPFRIKSQSLYYMPGQKLQTGWIERKLT